MAEILLKELSNADVDWLFSVGSISQVAAGTDILRQNEQPEMFHIILGGEVSWQTSGTNGQDIREIMRLGSGEVVGGGPLFGIAPLLNYKAATDVRLFSIEQKQLTAQLSTDVGFKARLYRAIALLYSARLRKLYADPDQLRFAGGQQAKEAMVVFGELRDSDIDWLISVGRIHQYAAPDDFLVQAGRPVESLDIVLSGQFSVLVFPSDSYPDPISLCFQCPYKTADSMSVVTNLTKGEMAGTIEFLDLNPHVFSIRTTENAMVLRIPRPQLLAKLLQDLGFSTRFHRMLVLQLLELLKAAIGDQGSKTEVADGGIDELDGEIDLAGLEQASQGAARFNWMLKQLGTVC